MAHEIQHNAFFHLGQEPYAARSDIRPILMISSSGRFSRKRGLSDIRIAIYWSQFGGPLFMVTPLWMCSLYAPNSSQLCTKHSTRYGRCASSPKPDVSAPTGPTLHEQGKLTGCCVRALSATDGVLDPGSVISSLKASSHNANASRKKLLDTHSEHSSTIVQNSASSGAMV